MMRIYYLVSLILSFTSGYRLENKIINGVRSPSKSWMVALRYNNGGGCGGVLYTKSLVISAAHCAKLDFKDWLAHLNRFDLSKDSEEGGSVHDVLRYVRHPQYSKTLQFDVSAWWIQSNSDIRTIVDLDDGSEFKDKSDLLSVAGWGRMKTRAPDEPVGKDPSSSILLEAKVPLNDDIKCIIRYPQEFDPETMLCTGYDVSGASTCQGDSGGPVYRARGDRIILIGIISHGKGCGYQDYYGEETKVSNPGVAKFIKKYAELFTLDNLDKVVLDLSERYRDIPKSNDKIPASIEKPNCIDELSFPVVEPNPSIESDVIDKYLIESGSFIEPENPTSTQFSYDSATGQPKLWVDFRSREIPSTPNSHPSLPFSKTTNSNPDSYPSKDNKPTNENSHTASSKGESSKPADSRGPPTVIYRDTIRTVYVPFILAPPRVPNEAHAGYHGNKGSATIGNSRFRNDDTAPVYPGEFYSPARFSSHYCGSSTGYYPRNYPAYDTDYPELSPLAAYQTHYTVTYSSYPDSYYQRDRPSGRLPGRSYPDQPGPADEVHHTKSPERQSNDQYKRDDR